MTSKQCGDGDDDDDLVTRETKEGERKVFQRALCPDPPHCTMCILSSMFSFQPNKLRHISKVAS